MKLRIVTSKETRFPHLDCQIFDSEGRSITSVVALRLDIDMRRSPEVLCEVDLLDGRKVTVDTYEIDTGLIEASEGRRDA